LRPSPARPPRSPPSVPCAPAATRSRANLSACFNCHKPLDKQDYVYLYDKMKAAAK